MSDNEFKTWDAGYQEGLQLITCVLQRGKADKVVKAALDAGAGGATVFFGRGMGLRERLGLLGLAIVPEKEVIMIVSKQTETHKIFDAIVKAAHLNTPGMGIAYVIPIHAVAGLFTGAEDEKAG
ncbi:MAG: P-II family nitrogen regulator [Bdellovibrionia bacterium]